MYTWEDLNLFNLKDKKEDEAFICLMTNMSSDPSSHDFDDVICSMVVRMPCDYLCSQTF